MKEKRYIAEFDLYIYAENDKEAIRKANVIKAILSDLDDNEAKITALWEKEFGTFGLREVNLEVEK